MPTTAGAVQEKNEGMIEIPRDQFVQKFKSLAQKGNPREKQLADTFKEENGRDLRDDDIYKFAKIVPAYKRFKLTDSTGEPPAFSAPGLISPGNIDLKNRPVVKNSDGTTSTVLTTTIEEEGRTILLPLIVGGKKVDVKEATDHYHKTGEHMGVFSSEDAAEKYDQDLHNKMHWDGPPGSAQEAWQNGADQKPRGALGVAKDIATSPFTSIPETVLGKGASLEQIEAKGSADRRAQFTKEHGADAPPKTLLGRAGYELTDPRSTSARFIDKTIEEVGGFGDFLMSPAGLVTSGGGVISRVASKIPGVGTALEMIGKAGSKIIPDFVKTLTPKMIRWGYGGTQAVQAATAAGDWWHDPTAENAAKVVSSGAIAALVFGPQGISETKKVSEKPAAPEAPPQTASPEVSTPTPTAPQQPALAAGTPPKQIAAGPAPHISEDRIQDIQSRTKLTRERIGTLDKLSTPDMLKRLDFTSQQLSQAPLPERDMRIGDRTDAEKSAYAKRQALIQDRTAIESLLKGRGIRLPGEPPPPRQGDVINPDTRFTRVPPQTEVSAPPAGGQPALPAGAPSPLQIGARGGFRYPSSQENRVVAAPTPGIDRVQANQFAQKHEIPADKFMQWSRASNQELRQQIDATQELRRKIYSADWSSVKIPDGYPTDKQEYVHAISKRIDAMEDLLLHGKRVKPNGKGPEAAPAPTTSAPAAAPPPEAPPAAPPAAAAPPVETKPPDPTPAVEAPAAPARKQPKGEVGDTRLRGGKEQVLAEVPIQKISGDEGNQIDEETAAKYKEKGYTKAPELRLNKDGNYTIEDGHHRILSDVRSGHDTVLAWVPKEEAPKVETKAPKAETKPAKVDAKPSASGKVKFGEELKLNGQTTISATRSDEPGKPGERITIKEQEDKPGSFYLEKTVRDSGNRIRRQRIKAGLTKEQAKAEARKHLMSSSK